MNTQLRFLLLALGILIGLHFILSVAHEDYNKATSLSSLKEKWRSTKNHYEYVSPEMQGQATNGTRRKVKAAFVILARNGDLQGVIESVKQIEDRFNKEFGYPYVFLNEEVFSDEFRTYTSEVISTKATYGLIPKEHWFQPDWIDEDKAKAAREDMIQKQVIYGGSVSYRNMCRFNSGFFFRHPLLRDYDYYWRFTITLPEYGETIETLWKTTKEFIKANPQYLPKDNAMGFVSDDKGESYNRCHYWSNFEIGDLNFWRGEAYTKYFEHLDKAGGFYYERWGDAPVHSIGVSLFAPKDKIHFFNDIGYRHEPFMHCPTGQVHAQGKCWCDQKQNFDYEWYSCLKHFEAA
ncbi:alpha 1,2-mannosyltransferase 2.4.1 [Tulasnella sp. 418]|nr:alpha 1,2-mannosyltransferase 2.4.1 [Tulasnella sp. 418]